MSTRQLRASLALWRRRLAYRERRHRFYHHRSRRPLEERRRLAAKWHKAQAEAERMVDRRERELKAQRSARERAVALASSMAGRTPEQPPGSNRSPIIDRMVRAVGSYLAAPWCGIFCGYVLKRVGVKGITSRIAAVSFIEDDARAGRAPFRGWTRDPRAVKRGDLVVLFGRGVHVELVVRVDGGVVHTVGGNTSAGSSGSQSNGGGAFKRARPMSAVHGFALVDYPNS